MLASDYVAFLALKQNVMLRASILQHLKCDSFKIHDIIYFPELHFSDEQHELFVSRITMLNSYNYRFLSISSDHKCEYGMLMMQQVYITCAFAYPVGSPLDFNELKEQMNLLSPLEKQLYDLR